LGHRSLFWGAAVLLLTNTFARLLGFGYRVILVRLLGTEGIGLTEMVTPLYSFCLVIAGWGIPLAMSRYIASEMAKKQYGNVDRIKKCSMLILSTSGLFITIFSWLFAPWLVNNFSTDPRILLCFRWLTPAIFIVAVCSGYRAYFQGIKKITIIGFSQNVEQIVRVSIGVSLAMLLLPKGTEIAIIAVSLGTVAGELSGLLYIKYYYYRHQKRRSAIIPQAMPANISYQQIGQSLITYGTPITMQRFLASLLLMLQAWLIPMGLQQAGYTGAAATELYGRFAGVALSLVSLPGVFSSTMSFALLPAIAECEINSNQLAHRINTSLSISTAISLPASLCLFLYGNYLCQWLFKCPEAAEPLKILALGGIFIYSHAPITSILQGLGKVKILFINLLISGGVFIAGLIILVPQPGLGIRGAAVAILASNIVNCFANLYQLRLFSGKPLNWGKIIVKPLFALLGAIGALLITKEIFSFLPLNQTIAAIAAIVVMISTYLIILRPKFSYLLLK